MLNSGSWLAFQVLLACQRTPRPAQDPVHGIGADHDPVLLVEVIDEHGQAPRGEGQTGLLRRGSGNAAVENWPL
ncbi:hypothetical protein [Mycolicibacterium sp.]|uniref:hypothetical protein n=1 Tax=Mycolicibacterium sp. TaxID=2320850 RepID=UPI003D10F97D